MFSNTDTCFGLGYGHSLGVSMASEHLQQVVGCTLAVLEGKPALYVHGDREQSVACFA